jgi:hypothetical protein
MTDKKDCATTGRNVLHLIEALLLKCVVTDCKHFVNDQNLRLQMGGDCKSQANIHAAAVSLDWRVEEFFNLRKRYDLIKFLRNLASCHPENRPV